MATAQTRKLGWVAIWGILALAAVPPGDVAGQFRRSSSDAKDQDAENVFLPPDRSVLQQLARAKQMLADEEYAEAAHLLDKILEEEEDSFYQADKNSLHHRSLKAEAQRLIGAMPDRGLQTYRLKFGAAAKMHLGEALAAGDIDGLAFVSRRYFHTDSGYEATLLLGLDHLNRARPLAAALTLQRLQDTARNIERFEPTLSLATAVAWIQAGVPDKAQDGLVKLKDRTQQKTIVLGGKQVPLFTEKVKALDWLAQVVGSLQSNDQGEPDRWVMMLGNAARNARVEGSQPLLNTLWHVPATDDPAIDGMLRQLRHMYTEQDQATLPSMHPLAVNDVVLMRNARTLLGIDFETGKRLWEAQVDDPLENAAGRLGPEVLMRQPNIGLGLGQRVWDDTTYGTLSSDGKLVFSIEDLGIGPNMPSGRTVIVGGRHIPGAPQAPSNRLAAHDIHNGKLKWHLGGPNDQFPLRQAETFFLGPPLPLMGQLYVLAESKNEAAVVLMALDAQNGSLLWQQRLAVVEETLHESPPRRMAGVSPSYCDGLLICPTGVGAVVAVDLATRSLLWGYRYRRDYDANQQQVMMRMNGFYQPGQPIPSRWTDGAAIIADRKVLITPVESDALHCLNLVDGTSAWKQPLKRQDDLYLACVHRDLAVLVGRRCVRAVALDKDGAVAWNSTTATYPEGTMPSGRGFLSDNKYYVPLTSAEVMAVDLNTGKVVETAKSRKGTVPGNMICYRGRVISQGVDGVETFYQRKAAETEVKRRLAADAADPVALALQGEVLLDQNKLSEAIDSFRRAFEKDGDPRTKGLLRDALLEGLRTQFAVYRPRVAEIQALLNEPGQQAAYLRVMAEGLQAAGEPLAAFEHYLRLLELDGVGRQLETISRTHSVRRDRWVQARLLGLLDETKEPSVRAKVDAVIQARLDATLQSGKINELQNFLNYLGGHSVAGAARRELAKRLVEADRVLEAEMALWRDQESTDPAIAGPAVAQIAEMLRKIGRPADAAACYARLTRDYADVVCLDGKTGRELAAALAAESPVRAALEAKDAWPIGLVEVTKKNKSASQPAYGRFGLRYDGSPAPFFKDVAVHFDQNQRAVIARDPMGKEMWRVTLGESQNNVYYNRGTTEGAVHGHLLMMALGNKIVAIDAVGNSTGKPGKLLWDHDLNASVDLAAARNLPMQLWGVMPWAFQNHQYSRASNRMNGIGPATSQVLCFQRFRNIVAVDPLSGDPLWTHGNVPPNAELFGDDDYVFALPRDETEALVFRALDGKPLGKRKIPRSAPGGGEYYHDARGQQKHVPITVSCMASFGRNMVLWRREGSSRLLEYYDPWLEKTLWGPLKFSDRAQIDAVDNEAVAICEAEDNQAHVVIVTLPDGKKVVDTKVAVKDGFSPLQNVTLLRYEGRYLLVTSNQVQASGRRPVRNIQPLPGMMMQPIQNGWVFGFNPDGQLTWPQPTPITSQYMAPEQPAGSPLLIFACQEYIQTGNSAQNNVLVACLDKRSGRMVYEEKFPGSINTFEIAVDTSEKTIELRFQQIARMLRLTDKPLPEVEKPPEGKPAPGPKTSPIKALFKALQKSAEEFVPPSDSEADPFG